LRPMPLLEKKIRIISRSKPVSASTRSNQFLCARKD
jgi:hypothetical protein